MRHLLILIATIIALGTMAFPQSADAASVYQWCPVGRLGWGETGAPSCGFSSYEQCVAVSGGVCTQNPFYTGPSSPQPGQGQRRQAR